jgi:hypothetical protein
MTNMVLLLGLLFGAIAVWMSFMLTKPRDGPTLRRPIAKPVKSDSWGVAQLRRGQADRQ